MEKIWTCKIGGKVGDLPAGADWPMRRAVQTAFETLTGVEASFTFSGWGATLTEGERAVHENSPPNWDAMQEAIDAGDGTLHGAIEYWHTEALRLRAELAECRAKHMDDLLVLGETAKAERELRAELAECKRDMDADDLPDCRMCRFFRCDDIGPFCLEEDERICTDGDLFAGRFMPTQPVRLYEVNNAPALAAKGKK